jgi:hypothetical protein
MLKVLLVGLAGVLFATNASGQHLGEVSLNYSYINYSPFDHASSVSLNGGGGAGALYFAGFFGIKGEFEAYGGKDISFNFPPGSPRCPLGCSGEAHANLFTISAGPVIKFRIKRFQPFVEGLVGAAHTDFYKNAAKNCGNCIISSTPGDYALAILIGGGIDFKLTRHLVIRPIEANYFMTRFVNNLTNGSDHQNNFRYQAGLVFEF